MNRKPSLTVGLLTVFGGATCPVMGAVFKTVVRVREYSQVGSTPTRLRHLTVVSGR